MSLKLVPSPQPVRVNEVVDESPAGADSGPEPTDVELMLAVRDGDTDAFTALVGRHFERLQYFFFRNLGDRNTAEDFAQEVFLKLFRAADRYSPQAKFTTFLYRIATNYLIDQYRSKSIRPTALSLYGGKPGGADGDETRLVDNLEGKSHAPGHDLEQSELEQRIMVAIHQLPDDQRIVFTMSEIEGMKYQDIAEALEIPLGTVKSRMHTAFHRLRELLSDLAPYEEDEQPAEGSASAAPLGA